MAHTTATTSHSTHPTRKYRLRNSPPSRPYPRPTPKHAPAATSPSSRGVLLPLQPNLRRLPSRIALFAAATMPALDIPQVGSKRKRVISTNENAHTQGRSLRKIKRRRGYKERDSEQSDMDVDDEEDAAWIPTDEDDEDNVINRDHYHLQVAAAHQLLRLRKEELVRLYGLADTVASETDHLTKHELVDSIVAARYDGMPQQSSSPHAGPPSSPSSTGVGEGDTEIDEPRPTRRLSGRSRSFSLGCLNAKKSTRFDKSPKKAGVLTRRRTSNNADRSSTTSSARSHSSSTTQSRRSSPNAVSSPLITRLRTRTVSFHFGVDSVKRPAAKSKPRRQIDSEESDHESDVLNLSPRRLRTRPGSHDADEKRRVTPMRKAKGRVVSLKESDDEESDELRGDEQEAGTDTELDEDQEVEEDEEVDELEPSLSPSPVPPRRKLRILRTRAQSQKQSPTNELRRTRTAPDFSTPRADRTKPRRARTQIYEVPSDGDDEEEETDGENHGNESEDDTPRGEDSTETEEMDIEVEPRRLRNGKVVGEEEEAVADSPVIDEEDEDAEGEEDDAASVDLEMDSNASASDASGSEISVDEVEEDGLEEDADEDEDLQDATAKTLVRRRRDHLVKLCESRGIEAEGTKPQLVEALLQWRDNHSTYTSSPSSGGTARPPSTTRPGRRNNHHAHANTPVLLRSDRVQASDPDTPHPTSNAQVSQQSDDGVLLDLEGLGLEDSVIPPTKLTKLEKIGSGGFKDVFVGKLGGKKVAIAEFRGQLTEMDIKELKLLSRFDHANVVKFLGVSVPENPKETPMIVSELCSNGDLFDYVRNVPPPHLNKVLSLMLDIARGLKYLHDHKPSVIHRDCKSSNILITSRVTAKIADFGLAKVKQSTRSMVRSLVGTVNWQAPELWHAHPKYNFKVDVFSCAMVFWEILQWHAKEKKFPWEGMNEHAIYEAVGAKQQRPSTSGLAKTWCPEIVELIERMWAQDHKDRPDMTHVVEELEKLKSAYPPPRIHAKAR